MPPSSPSSASSVAGPSGLSCTSLSMSIVCFCFDTINAWCGETMYLMNVAIVLALVCMSYSALCMDTMYLLYYTASVFCINAMYYLLHYITALLTVFFFLSLLFFLFLKD